MNELMKPNVTGPVTEEPPPPDLPPPAKLSGQRDAAAARVQSVAELLAGAYAKASTLELTPDESAKLTAMFPDEAVLLGANGDPNLPYIEHAWIRERLMEVIGPGQWALINRRTWLDERDGYMYADCVLVVRGCYVGEAIGAQRWIPGNKRLNYSDAVEGAQSEALRRVCGKYLNIGLQVWKKSYCEEWKARQRQPKGAKAEPTPTNRPAATTAEALGKFVGQVLNIEAKQTHNGKPYRVLQFKGEPRRFSTWHLMAEVGPGSTLTCKISSMDRNGVTYWSIDEYEIGGLLTSKPLFQEKKSTDGDPNVPVNAIWDVRKACEQHGVTEAEVLNAIFMLGAADEHKTLEELAAKQPEVLAKLVGQVATIAKVIQQVKAEAEPKADNASEGRQ